MSENMVDLQIKADISDLQKKTKEAEKGFKDVQKAMENLNKIKLSGAEVDAKREWEMLNKVLQSSTEYAGALQKQMEAVAQNDGGDKNTKAYTELEKKLREVNEVIKETEEEVKNMGKSADETGDDFKSIENNADKAGNEVKDLANSNLDNLSSSVNALQVAFGNLIDRGIRVAYNGIKNLAVSVKDAGQDFDEAIGTLKALYGDAVDEAGMQRVVDVARELGTTSAYSATEVAEAMRFMALAGYNAEETTTSISSALDLASASGEDFEVVASILVDGLKAFNMGVDESNKFANVLAQTAVSTNADVSDLGDAFKYAGALSGTFGYDIGDVAVALGAMAENGVKGSIAGTALRQIMTRLATNTSGARDEFEALGGQFYDAEGNARPLIDVLEDLRNGLAGATDEEKANSLATIGGQRAITGLSAVVKTSAEHWEYLKEEIADSEGAVNQIAQMRLDNFAGDVKKLSNNWEEVKLQLYDGVEPALRKTAQSLIKLMQSADFKKFIKQVSELASEILNGLVKAIEFLVENFDEVILSIKLLGIALAGIKIIDVTKKFLDFGNTIKDMAMAGSGLASILGGVGVALAGFVAVIGSAVVIGEYAKNSWEEQNEAIIEIGDSSRDYIQSVKDMNIASQEEIDTAKGKETYYQSLVKELDRIIDANGYIKEGYENRADYILNELSSAYGIEYELVDGQIKKWKDLKEAISEASEQRMADAIMSAKESNYIDAKTNEGSLQNAQATAQVLYNEQVEIARQNALDSNANFWKYYNGDAEQGAKAYASFMQLSVAEQTKYLEENSNALVTLNSNTATYKKGLDEANQALAENDNVINDYMTTIGLLAEDDGLEKYFEYQNNVTSGSNDDISNNIDMLFQELDKIPVKYTSLTNEMKGKTGDRLIDLTEQRTALEGDIADIVSQLKSLGATDDEIIASVSSMGNGYVTSLTENLLEELNNSGLRNVGTIASEVIGEGMDITPAVNSINNQASQLNTAFDGITSNSQIAGTTMATALANGGATALSSVGISIGGINAKLSETSTQAQATSTTLSGIGNNVDFTSLLSQLSTVETQTETTGTTAGTKLATSFGASTSTSMATQIATLGTTMSAKMVGVTDGMNTSLNSGGTKIAGTMRSITSKANDSNVLTTALGYSKGMNYVSGVNSGLQSGLWNVQQTANQIAQTVDGALQKAWQIHSPSRVAYGIADFFMQGLNNGLSDSIPLLKGTAGVVANSITTGIELASDTLNNGALAIDNINATNDITSTFKNALREVQLVVNVNNDMDGREIAQRVSTIQGMEIKKAGI